jgi:UDP:flavonoid glycosyltransferase YjiC (YdhE family)
MTARRVLFAWELGANLGHLSRNLPLARKCREMGYEVVWAVPNLRASASQFKNEGFDVLQAPLLRPSPAQRSRVAPINFADLLLKAGYEDDHSLAGALDGWRGLLRLVRPDALVYDHAPTALIAARAAAAPVLIVGTGFEIPPLVSPMPALRPWEQPPADELRAMEAKVVSQINVQLARIRHASIQSLAELYGLQPQFIASFRELDPFTPRPMARYVGPVYALGDSSAIGWASTGKSRVFVYVRSKLNGWEVLLAALNSLDAEVLCSMPGHPPDIAARFPALRFIDGVTDLGNLLRDANLIVTSGAGTISTALLAGVPALVAPENLEQLLAGRQLAAIGAGLVAKDCSSQPLLHAQLQQLLYQPTFRAAARRFAHSNADFDHSIATTELFAALQSLMESAETA